MRKREYTTNHHKRIVQCYIFITNINDNKLDFSVYFHYNEFVALHYINGCPFDVTIEGNLPSVEGTAMLLKLEIDP